MRRPPETPRVWHDFGDDSLWFQWALDDHFWWELELVGTADAALVRQVRAVPRNRERGTVPRGGLSATVLHSIQHAELEKQAAAMAQGMATSPKPGDQLVSGLAGFTLANADPVIRPRGRGRTPQIIHAAVAKLYARGLSRRDLAQRVNYSEGTVKSWIAAARDTGLLSRVGRETSDHCNDILREDGRDPLEIIKGWSRA